MAPIRQGIYTVGAMLATCAVWVCSAESAAQQPLSDRMSAWAAALGVDCAHCHVPNDWSNASVPAFAFAQRMMRMVDGVNAGPARGTDGITCWTCHRGRPTPARLPRDAWQTVQERHAAEFSDSPDVALTMSVYAASLGVDCEFCNDADRAAPGKPPKRMVQRMNLAIEEIPKYFDESRRPTTQCFLCHQGERRPHREPGA